MQCFLSVHILPQDCNSSPVPCPLTAGFDLFWTNTMWVSGCGEIGLSQWVKSCGACMQCTELVVDGTLDGTSLSNSQNSSSSKATAAVRSESGWASLMACSFCQPAPQPRTGCISGYGAQIRILTAPNPPINS